MTSRTVDRKREELYPLAYCTNVHAGADFEQMFANLRKYAPRVQQMRESKGPMGLGLWFSNRSVVEALKLENSMTLREWLEEHSLVPFTANAFPQHDFHQAVVKHAVYEPDWATAERAEYTLEVFRLMDALAPSGLEISVSTVPLGWPRFEIGTSDEDAFFQSCTKQLLSVCRWLEELERSSGRLAYLCIEPEPGCILDSSDDIVRFFQDWLLVDGARSELVRRHLRVCHDICHSAVMFESQAVAIERYRKSGIRIGKVQVSSAVEATFSASAASNAESTLALQKFIEPRYLHQTNVKRGDDVTFYEDLPNAFAAVADPAGTCWRVHFHVPIFAEHIGPLGTTNREIAEFVNALGTVEMPRHFEVETYAWSVLPESLATKDLAAGIASEMDWFEKIRGGVARD